MTTKPDSDSDTFATGSHWALFIPPSWILGGTIEEDTGTFLVLKNPVYIENVSPGVATLSHVPMAETPAAKKPCVSASYPLPQGTRIRKEGVLIAAPSVIGFECLVDDAARKALEK